MRKKTIQSFCSLAYNLEMELSHHLGKYDAFDEIAEHKRLLKVEGGITLYSFAVTRWQEALPVVVARNVKTAMLIMK
jgi:hypothetical protein